MPPRPKATNELRADVRRLTGSKQKAGPGPAVAMREAPVGEWVFGWDFVLGLEGGETMTLVGGGNSNIFGMFIPKFGEDFQFDKHIFQMG